MISSGVRLAFVKRMLRITTQTRTDLVSLKLEGSLKGPWVDELATAWSVLTRTPHPATINVDLHAVNFVDERGRDLLLRIRQEGAVLKGASGFVNKLLGHEIEKS
jgi:hypothetical protein